MVCLGVLGASRKHIEILSGCFVLASITLLVDLPSETTPPPLSQRAPRRKALTAPAFEALTPIQPSIVAKLFSKLSMFMPSNFGTPPRKARDDSDCIVDLDASPLPARIGAPPKKARDVSDRIVALAASPLPARIGQLARDLPKNSSKAQSKGKTPATKPKAKKQNGTPDANMKKIRKAKRQSWLFHVVLPLLLQKPKCGHLARRLSGRLSGNAF